MFRKDQAAKIEDVVNIENEYINRAEKFKLKLLKSQDITANVLPTMKYTQNCLKEYVNPSVKTLKHFLFSNSSFKSKILTWVFSKQLKKLNQILNYYLRRTNPEFFTTNIKYLRLLFQIK